MKPTLIMTFLFQVNTLRAEYVSQGMNHFEGGWPKDINPQENDQTMRFRKKIEKDDTYINTVLGLCSVSIFDLLFYRQIRMLNLMLNCSCSGLFYYFVESALVYVGNSH